MLLHCIFVRIIFYGKSAISSFVHLYLTCLFFSEIISWLKCFSVLNTFYKISDISHFLSQGSPGGSRMWTPPRAFDVAILLQRLNLRNLNSCRRSQTTCVIYDNSCILTYIFTHTHTHHLPPAPQVWCYLVNLLLSLPVTLYWLKSQSREVRREIAGAYATVKNLYIGHMSD